MVAALKPGDVVWAKLKGYRWWPAKIEDELGLSENVLKSKPKKKASVTPVFFYGSSDYAWLGYDSVLPYLDNYDRFSTDPSKPQLFLKSLNDANKALGRLSEASEDLQAMSNSSEVAKFLEQAETLSNPLKKKRARPNKILEDNRVTKNETKINQIKQDKTSINYSSHDSASENLLIVGSSKIVDSENNLFLNKELEATEDNSVLNVKTLVQTEVGTSTPRSKKTTIKDLKPESSPTGLGKFDSRNVLKKRGNPEKNLVKNPVKNPAKNPTIQTKKRGRSSKLSTNIEPNLHLSKNTLKEFLISDSPDLVENRIDLNLCEELTKPQASMSTPKSPQVNGLKDNDLVDKVCASNLIDGLSSSENEAANPSHQSNIPIQLNPDLVKLQVSDSQPLLDTFSNTNPGADILCEKNETSVTQDTKLTQRTSTVRKEDPVSSHAIKSSRLDKSPKSSIDMCQLRHELQKLAITEKMKNRSKLEYILNIIDSSSPTADDLTKSKLIKVFRHIIRDKVADPSDKISVHCRKLYKRFKAILEENDNKVSESQDISISFNPDTSILTSNSVY